LRWAWNHSKIGME